KGASSWPTIVVPGCVQSVTPVGSRRDVTTARSQPVASHSFCAHSGTRAVGRLHVRASTSVVSELGSDARSATNAAIARHVANCAVGSAGGAIGSALNANAPNDCTADWA